MSAINLQGNERPAGSEIVHGPDAGYRRSMEILDELGMPRGVLPLKGLIEEWGMVKETGFLWMKLKAPHQHYYAKAKILVSYAPEVTAYVEKHKITKVTGIKTKQLLVWVPVAEMFIEDPASEKLCVKAVGFTKSYPFSVFLTEEEEKEKNKK